MSSGTAICSRKSKFTGKGESIHNQIELYLNKCPYAGRLAAVRLTCQCQGHPQVKAENPPLSRHLRHYQAQPVRWPSSDMSLSFSSAAPEAALRVVLPLRLEENTTSSNVLYCPQDMQRPIHLLAS